MFFGSLDLNPNSDVIDEGLFSFAKSLEATTAVATGLSISCDGLNEKGIIKIEELIS